MLPVQVNQRIQYLDVLRGFAISGVLFAYVFWNLGTEPVSNWTSFDKTLDQLGIFIVDSKCYTILACLFSVGFVLHMNKAKDKMRSLYIYRRRLVGLFLIGILHAVLLRNGDILAPYAILMFIASFFYNAKRRTIVIALASVLLLQTVLPQIWAAMGLSFPDRPDAPGGNYWVENFQWVRYWYSTAIFLWETTLVLLLAGVLAGRLFIERKAKFNNRQLSMIIAAGLFVGTGSYLMLHVYSTSIENLPAIRDSYVVRTFVHNLLDLAHKTGMASAYACIIFLLARNFRITIFAALGRMSLTNYIVQALIVVPVCIAFNLFDHLTPTIALVMTAAILGFEILFSRWWLNHFRFGPLEWVLRRFTYGKNMLIKKEAQQDLARVPAI